MFSLLNDKEIKKLAIEKKMIEPFVDHVVRERGNKKVISYGLSSFGYDIRLGERVLLVSQENVPFSMATGAYLVEPEAYRILDPKAMDESLVQELPVQEDTKGRFVILPPRSFVLAHSVEYIRMPEDVVGLVFGKSTYARSGIIPHVTPLEPGWEGVITLEFSNTSIVPVKMYLNEGCCQVMFLRGNQPAVTYASRKGKYQGQTGITLPKA